jgi:hypothetical protein
MAGGKIVGSSNASPRNLDRSRTAASSDATAPNECPIAISGGSWWARIPASRSSASADQLPGVSGGSPASSQRARGGRLMTR